VDQQQHGFGGFASHRRGAALAVNIQANVFAVDKILMAPGHGFLSKSDLKINGSLWRLSGES
jgi:hypothetical protein